MRFLRTTRHSIHIPFDFRGNKGTTFSGKHKSGFSFSAFCQNIAIYHTDQPTRHPSIFLGVGNHHDGHSFTVQFHQQVHHFIAVDGIQVSGRDRRR